MPNVELVGVPAEVIEKLDGLARQHGRDRGSEAAFLLQRAISDAEKLEQELREIRELRESNPNAWVTEETLRAAKMEGARVIVADTNLIAYYLIKGDETEKAETARWRDSVWVAPQIWSHEFLNVLATNVRKGIVRRDSMHALWEKAHEIIGEIPEHEPSVAHVVDLSVAKRIATFDSMFAQFAINAGLPLVTNDKTLLERVPSVALSIGAFAAGRL